MTDIGKLWAYWSLLDLAKELRQIDKDNRTYNKWILLLLSLAALYSLVHNEGGFLLVYAFFGAWAIYDIFRDSAQIREQDARIARLRQKIYRLYAPGRVDEEDE